MLVVLILLVVILLLILLVAVLLTSAKLLVWVASRVGMMPRHRDAETQGKLRC
jgi:hypothetical protein